MAEAEKKEGGDKDEAKDDDAAKDEKEEGAAQEGGEAEGEADDDAPAVALHTEKVSASAFYKEQAKIDEVPERGDSHEMRMHWTRPRRWDVRIWGMDMENTTQPEEEIMVFANLIFGGSKKEFLVKTNKEPEIWVAGEEGKVLRTPVVHDKPGDDEGVDIIFDERFEWHGSYVQLESQVLRIELWNWSRWRINKFDCFAELPLIELVKGGMHQEVDCNKYDKFGKPTPRAKIRFKLYFQEIYDFDLDMSLWRASYVPTCKQLYERVVNQLTDDDFMADVTPGRETRRTTIPDMAAKQRSLSMESMVQQSIEITTPSNAKHMVRPRRLAAKPASNISGTVEWSKWVWGRFRTAFRGTTSDLNNRSLDVMIWSYETYHELELDARPSGAYRRCMPLGQVELPLRGIVGHGEIKAQLNPAPWFFDVENGEFAHRQRCGLLQGNIAVENFPRYMQSDDVSDELDLRKRYLFVKVIKVDRVVTPDTRPTDQIDTFVEVTYAGSAKRTRICQDDVSPGFNDELIFELALSNSKGHNGNEPPPDNVQVWEEIERKGPVHMDLWTLGTVSNEHLGSCEAFLQEVLVDARGQAQPQVPRTAMDSRTQKQESFNVRAFRGSKRLHFVWGEGQESNLFYEMWLLPDLDPQASLSCLREDTPVPKPLEEAMDACVGKWGEITDMFLEEDATRDFKYNAKSIWPIEVAAEHILPRFVDVVRPPRGMNSPQAICHYVGCYPYLESRSLQDALSTPNFFTALRKGEILEHAILHCSLLLGLALRAYVCLGTSLKREPHAWVAVFLDDGSVCFWESFLGTGSMVLPERFAHPEHVVPMEPTPRSLRPMDIEDEIKRRKRLKLHKQKDGSNGPLVLQSGSHHAHPMRYIDVQSVPKTTRKSAFSKSKSNITCDACSKVFRTRGFYRGFECEDEQCQAHLCWECADKEFNDIEDIENMRLKVTDEFDFEAYLNGKLREPKYALQPIPYRTLDVVFNHQNMWANLQHHDPRKIFWDLWNPCYWHPFASKTQVAGLRPIFSAVHFPMGGRDDAWAAKKVRDVLQHLRRTIQGNRANRNLATRWVQNPQLIKFLEVGLKIRADMDMQGQVVDDEDDAEETKSRSGEDLKAQLKRWEKMLCAKTPPRYKLTGMPLHFNICDEDEIANRIIDVVSFVWTREKTVQFALAAHCIPLPGEVVSFYIYICELHALSDMQVVEEVEKRKNKSNDYLTQAQRLRNLFKQQTQAQEGKGQRLISMILGARDAMKDGEKATKPLLGALKGLRQRRSVLSTSPLAQTNARPLVVEALKVNVVMTGFRKTFHSSYVSISETGLEAEYVGSKSEDGYKMCGGLVSNGPIPDTGEGKFFEVRIKKTTSSRPEDEQGFVDGLTLGITTTSPQVLTDVPGAMIEVPDSWLAGFEKSWWNPMVAKHTTIDWDNSELEPGDKVGFLVTPDGGATVFMNGRKVHQDSNASIPFEQQLFAVIDLMGNTDAVELLVDRDPPDINSNEVAPQVSMAQEETHEATPKSFSLQQFELEPEEIESKPAPEIEATPVTGLPVMAVVPAAVIAKAAPAENVVESIPPTVDAVTSIKEYGPMTSFDKSMHSGLVKISASGLEATYVGTKEAESYTFCGGVLGNGFLAETPRGKYFAVEILRTGQGHPDGLVIGVTATQPHEIGLIPETMDGVMKSWLAGYDGQWWGQHEFSEIHWNASKLHSGDVVGFLAEPSGTALIFVNDEVVLEKKDATISYAAQLFASIDLLGSADAVRLLPLAKPPSTNEGQNLLEVNHRKNMRGFSPHVKGACVSLSEDCLSATYTGKTGDEMFGGLVGDLPLKVNDDGSVYFEVKLQRVRHGKLDGLTLGISSQTPREIQEMPETIDGIAEVWAVGYDGGMFDGITDTWTSIPWASRDLKVGDHVGVLVAETGRMHIFENGKHVATGPGSIPVHRSLYALVDLIGNADAVTLCLNAEPPDNYGQLVASDLAEVSSVVDVKPVMEGFCRERLGKFISLSEDGKTAKYTGKPGTDDLQGGLLGDGPLRSWSDGWYFEVRIDSVVPGLQEGLAVGVTTCRPDALVGPELPETMDEVDPCWLLGFDCAEWDGAKLVWGPAAWQSSTLEVGDRVGVRATRDGKLQVFVNGQAAAQGTFALPDRPLFAVVDLMGTTTGVTFLPAAEPPAIAALPQQIVQVTETMTHDPFDDTPPGSHVVSVVSQEADRIPDLPLGPLKFHTVKHGKAVQISDDGLTARHRVGADEALDGGVLGACRLRESAHGFYFEVRVDDVGSGCPDGLAIGVTTVNPERLQEVPEVLDGLQSTWLVGFDGAISSPNEEDFKEIDWHPSELRIGDRVGVLVTTAGDLSIYVNDRRRVDGPQGVPVTAALCPVVDLIGNTHCVTLLPNAPCPVPGREPAPGQRVTGFSRTALGQRVRVSVDGWCVERADVQRNGLQAVALGADPLEMFEGRGRYFEVHVDEIMSGQWPEGLALGITSRRPEELRELPDTADSLAPCWLAGYDGALWDGLALDWHLSSWDTRELQPGDIVGVLLTAQAELRILLNGKVVAGGMHLPEEKCGPKSLFYPVVDLLGSVRRISLLPRGEPPEVSADTVPPPPMFQEFGNEQQQGLTMTGFDRSKLGLRLESSADGIKCSRRPGRDMDAGLLIGNHPLRFQPDGSVGFSLLIDDVANGSGSEGMALGVTTQSPAKIPEWLPDSADQVDVCWLLGFDGAAWDGSLLEWSMISWNPSSLKKGDRADLIATAAGELQVFVNGALESSRVMRIPVGPKREELFALVDLMGATLAVSFVSAVADIAHPTSRNLSRVAGEVEEVDAAPMAEPEVSLVTVDSAKDRFDPVMRFASSPVAPGLQISADGRSVIRRDDTADSCVAFGGKELKLRHDGSKTFAISVTRVHDIPGEGLAIGFTATSPESLSNAPGAADEVPRSFLVGFDGATWDGTDWGMSDWHPGELEVGDTIQVTATATGNLTVTVNGMSKASHDLRIPVADKLWPIMGIQGQTAGITLLPAAS